MGHLADKLTGLSNSCSSPQSACQWTHISGSRARDRERQRYSFVFSIYFMYLALLSLASGSIICMVSLGVSRSCSASHFVFIASFSFFASSLTFSGAPKRFSAAYLNSWKIQLLSLLLLFTSKQFLFFLFVAQINTSSINYPAKETTVRVRGRWQIEARLGCTVCVSQMRSLYLN